MEKKIRSHFYCLYFQLPSIIFCKYWVSKNTYKQINDCLSKNYLILLYNIATTYECNKVFILIFHKVTQ